jgi:hypothetical protein
MDEQSVHRIREQMARVAAQLAENAAFQAKSDKYLDRVERLLIREARQERTRRRKMDERLDDKITQLAAAQLITEERLRRLIDSRLGTNGKS